MTTPLSKLTVDELKVAHMYWHYEYKFKESDHLLAPFLQENMHAFDPHQNSGQSEQSEQSEQIVTLKRARQGLFLSSGSLAKKLNISRAAYCAYEEKEKTGNITLATLAAAAEAMDCELVYAIRPKRKKHFSQIIWNTLLAASLKHPWLKKCDQKQRGRALAAILKKNMGDASFRREQGWSQRANT